MKHLIYPIALVCAIVFNSPVFAQYWTNLGEVKGGTATTPRPDLHQYQSVELDWQGFTQQLAQTPMEYNPSDEFLTVQLPVRDGKLERFNIVEYYAMHPKLAAKYPDIHTYWGIGIDNPTSTVRLTNSRFGIHAVILTVDGSIFMETVDQTTRTDYAVFMKADAVRGGTPLGCQLIDAEQILTEAGPAQRIIGEEILVYRVAISSAPLYTNLVGGIAATNANIANAVNAVNAILERDVSIRLQLVANNDLLIFTNANNPYSNQSDVLSNMIENPSVVNGIIGGSNYDIGHVFTSLPGTTGGGVATSPSVCASFKARGSSGKGVGPFSLFYYEIAAHEMGHQFGALHNFNSVTGGCGMGNHSPQEAREPGSGTTIMCYSGLCGADNIQAGTDDYYHGGSIEAIVSYTRNSNGNSCVFNTIATNNLPPVVDAGISDLFVPLSTPFVLRGSATDPDGDAMTYCWEQMDQGPPGTPNLPVGNAPLFRSFPPSNSPDRTFPRISNVVANSQTLGELLPDYARDLTFRLTARDNMGGVTSDDVAFEVAGNAGPFLVTHPNVNQTFTAGNFEEITWDVANTHLQPVNCQLVNILLSVDGGFTYPYTLAENVPNDGQEYIVFPDTSSFQCRIRVQAADNVFFDISNQNFTIELPAAAGYTLFPLEDTLGICGDLPIDLTIWSTSFLGFSDSVDLTVAVLPPGVSATTNTDKFFPGDTIEITLIGDGSTPAGIYPLIITSISGSVAVGLTLQIEVGDPNDIPETVALLSPTGGTNLQPSINFDWDDAQHASSYWLEVATSPAFGTDIVYTVSGLTSTEYALPFDLDNSTVYYWRVKGTSICGDGPFSTVSAFQTGECSLQEPTDLPLDIPLFGAPAVATSLISPSINGIITSVGIQNFKGTHDALGEIKATLTSPSGTVVTLFNEGDLCDTTTNFLKEFNLDFSQSGASTLPCPPNDGQSYAPVGDFSQFVNEPALGLWTLSITDATNFNGGELVDWDLVLCTAGAEVPEVITNLPLAADRWSLASIEQTLLEASSASFGPADVTFTLVERPDEGGLKLSGTTIPVGGTFTQADINNGALSYLHYGDTIAQDAFVFDVRNAGGGWIGTFTFNIDLKITTGIEPIIPAESLKIYPNPASNLVWVEIDRDQTAAVTDIELLNVQGQMISRKELLVGSTKVQFAVDQLSAGLYFVKINTAKGSQLEKLLIE